MRKSTLVDDIFDTLSTLHIENSTDIILLKLPEGIDSHTIQMIGESISTSFKALNIYNTVLLMPESAKLETLNLAELERI
jgi:hypothetical protein